MSSKYITNQEETIAEAVNHIEGSSKIDILVGYFYFSGLKKLLQGENSRKNFLETRLRILVGMEIDTALRAEISPWNSEERSGREEKESYKEQLTSYLNGEAFDDTESLRLFFEKLENGTLEIRKTKQPVHAKVYLFAHGNNPDAPYIGTMITGSSNLSAAGLGGQLEFNGVDNDKAGFLAGQEFFNSLWEDSILLLDAKAAAELKPHIGLLANPTPYEVFLKVLHEYFAYTTQEQAVYLPSRAGFNDYRYQTDAVRQTVQMILSHGGALLADVVGLGKTIIAASAAKTLLDCGEVDDVYIICPPALIDSWENYKDRFELMGEVYSRGDMENLHRELSRPMHQNRRYLILIDEAHGFRNPETNAYGYLSQICAGNRVLLLTATPLNNTTADIFSLIELFQDLGCASIHYGHSIVNIKEDILKKEKELRRSGNFDDRKKILSLSKRILELIAPVLVRRTRTDLLKTDAYREDLEKQKTEFNRVEDPELEEYSLGKDSNLYEETLELINPREEGGQEAAHFLGVRYQALYYLKKDPKIRERILCPIYPDYSPSDDNFIASAARNLSGFMRHMLVRRFESSLEAFRASIGNMLNRYEMIEQWISKGRFPIFKEGGILDAEKFHREAFLYDDCDAIDEDGIVLDKTAAEKKGVHIIEKAGESFEPEFFELLKKDREILLGIQKRWKAVTIDHKLEKLKERLQKWQKENKLRKIVIFSEFADTVNYLGRELAKEFRIISFTSGDKREKRERIIANFDASKPEHANDYDILIATDTLSEGVNLHRAGIIVNYDIPYNPTRVIQRVGRINRIGAKNFDELYIHNFIPRLEAQNETKNWQIANFKMDLINAVLGNDSKTLNKEEDIKAVFSIHNNKELLDSEGLSWDTHYRNIYTALQEKKTQLYEKIQKLPPRLEIGRAGDRPGLLEVRRVNHDLFATAYFGGGDITHSVEDVFKLLQAEAKETALPNTDNLFALRYGFKNLKPQRDKNYSHDALIALKQFLAKCPEKDQEYIKTIRDMGEKRRLSLNTLGRIRKLMLGQTGQEILPLLKQIIPDIYLKKLRQQEEVRRQSFEKAQLLVTEEWIQCNPS